MEAIRADVPALNRFYLQYLDVSKDNVVVHDDDRKSGVMNPGGGGIVVSHMALIVGCAAPLWIASAATPAISPSKKQSSSLFHVILSLLGVICLGVGDAVGALVGRYYGRQRPWWGRQGRTLEGSVSMLVSMILSTHVLTLAVRRILLSETDSSQSLMTTIMPSLIFMTILEAYTTQIDNLVLPLAGSAVFLLSSQQQYQYGKPT